MIFKNRSSGWNFAASVPSRLSHFVAPLYVAPSPTPSNATSQRRVGSWAALVGSCGGPGAPFRPIWALLGLFFGLWSACHALVRKKHRFLRVWFPPGASKLEPKIHKNRCQKTVCFQKLFFNDFHRFFMDFRR